MKNLLLDNIIFSLQRAGGISVVWANLINNITQHGIDFKCIEYGASKNIYQDKLNISDDRIINSSNKALDFRRYFSPTIKINSPTIFHSSYYRTINSPLVKNITTVHDFTYEYFNHGPRAWIHKWQKFNAIRNSERIVCVSNHTKSDLLKFFPEVSSDKISVIYNGVSNSYKKLSSPPYSEYSDCLLFIGAREGYKNFDFAIEASKSTKHRLIVCGNPLNDIEKKKLITNLGESGFISFNRPTNELLNKLYNSVFALIYPSSYEGFGIPVIEAQKAGCPVVSLNASSIPEIIGEDYPMLNNLTINEVISLDKTLRIPNFRDNIINHGIENSKRFSWKKMGEQYIDIYKSL
ncbi:MAG: glycosyltransferase family 4 protein [Barnesiella sp.]|nr:glycosyltransferase family 4 protein [Barnesiella sp.]